VVFPSLADELLELQLQAERETFGILQKNQIQQISVKFWEREGGAKLRYSFRRIKEIYVKGKFVRLFWGDFR